METSALGSTLTDAPDQILSAEIAGLEVMHFPGCLRTQIYIREGIESLFSVYSITGQLRFRKRILNSGPHEFDVDLQKGVYVATLVSGKNWAARRISVN